MTFNRIITGATAVAAFALASCSGGQQNQPAQTEAQKAPEAATQEVKTYSVGTNPVFAPFEYTNQAGDILGFDIDVLDAIGRDQNVKFTYKNVPWDGIFATLESGDVDALASAITITEERQQKMDFTNPYYEVTQLIVVPQSKQVNSIEELKNLGKVGVVNAQTGDVLMQKYLGATSPKIARYDTLPLLFKEIQVGGVDVGVSDSAAVQYYIKSNPDTSSYKLVKFDDFPVEKYGFAVKKGDAALLKILNDGLANIKASGEYDKILSKYFANGESLGEKVDNAVEAVKDAAGAAADATKDKAEEAKQALGDAVDATKEAAKDAADATKEAASDAYDATKEKAKEVGDAVKQTTSDAVDATKEATKNAYDATKEAAGNAADATKEKAKEVGDAVKETTSNAVDAIKNAAGKAADATKEAAKDAKEAVHEATK